MVYGGVVVNTEAVYKVVFMNLIGLSTDYVKAREGIHHACARKECYLQKGC